MRASRRCIFVPPSEFVLSLESLVAIASSNEAFAYARLITLRLATGDVNTRTHIAGSKTPSVPRSFVLSSKQTPPLQKTWPVLFDHFFVHRCTTLDGSTEAKGFSFAFKQTQSSRFKAILTHVVQWVSQVANTSQACVLPIIKRSGCEATINKPPRIVDR